MLHVMQCIQKRLFHFMSHQAMSQLSGSHNAGSSLCSETECAGLGVGACGFLGHVLCAPGFPLKAKCHLGCPDIDIPNTKVFLFSHNSSLCQLKPF